MNALLNHVWGKSPAQDRVWAQVTGMAPNAAVRQLIMALSFQAFIDDSVTAPGPDREFVLAGHIAPAEAWARFAKEWEVLLPSGTLAENGKYHFKMFEMAKTTERMERVPAFYWLIENHATISISCRMNLIDFAKARASVRSTALNLGITIDYGHWDNPYYVVFRGLMDNFHSERERIKSEIALDETVDFIFDDQSEKSFILAAWNEYLAVRPDEIRGYYGATPRFENDQKFLPLQAADLWAWWVRRWYEEDAITVPDKMRAFDFGKWRGKRRPVLAFSYNEDNLIKTLETQMFENIRNARQDGKTIFPDGDDL